jgi:phosphoribosylanthranilate isomerase
MGRIIKICGLKDPENILRIIQLNPDWIGLIFYPGSPRFVSDIEILRFLNNLTGKPLITAVFVNPDIAEVDHVTSGLRIDMIQFHGTETPATCQKFRDAGFLVMKAFAIQKDFDFTQTEKYQEKADYFLFDTPGPKHGGTGEQFSWELLSNYHGKTPFLLSGGISPDTVAIPDHPHLAGLDLNSRFEISPGIKNIELLKKFINKIRND